MILPPENKHHASIATLPGSPKAGGLLAANLFGCIGLLMGSPVLAETVGNNSEGVLAGTNPEGVARGQLELPSLPEVAGSVSAGSPVNREDEAQSPIAGDMKAIPSEAAKSGAVMESDERHAQSADAPNNKSANSKVYNYPQMPQARAKVPVISWGSGPDQAPQALVDAIKLVTQKDPAARIAWSQARAALSGVRAAQWLRAPTVTADLSLSDTLGSQSVLGANNHLVPSISVDLPIWTSGRIRSTIRRAKSIEDAAVAQWQETVLNLAIQVNDTYFQIVLNTRLENLYLESLVEHERLVQTMVRRVKQEISPNADLELARSRVAQIEQDLTTIHSQRLSAMRTLAELVRDPNYQLGNVPLFDAKGRMENWLGVEAEAIAYSPTRLRLSFEAESAKHQISIARSSIFPQLNAQYSYSELTGSRFGLGLRVQSTSGLSQLSEVESAKGRYDAAISQIALTERQLKEQLGNEVIAYEAAIRRSAVSRNASETAGRVSDSYMRQFIAGRRSWLDVMNSLREHLTAQSGLTQAEVTAMSLSIRLNLRSGRWHPEFIEGSK